jgi:capsular polysaccharide biosynthesis protein
VTQAPDAPPSRRPQSLGAALSQRRPRRVFVIASNGSEDLLTSVLPEALDIIVVSPTAPPGWALGRHGARHVPATDVWEVNWQLKRFGPVDVIIDVSADPGLPHDETWRITFLHLRDGGLYVSAGDSSGALRRRSVEFLTTDRPSRLEQAIESVTVSGDTVQLAKRGDHHLKLLHREVDRFLPTRDEGSTSSVLVRRPPTRWVSRCELHSHGTQEPVEGLESTMSFPELTLRHYRGAINMSSHSLIFTEGALLPESFRHFQKTPLQNDYVTDVTGQFGTIADDHRPMEHLAGTYYHLDSPYPGHFGHVMTETISRLWGWQLAKARIPDLKAIWRIRYPNERDPEFERILFGAFGIDESDMVWLDRPVTLESVVGVTPMWHNQVPHTVHPEIETVWERLRNALGDVRVDSPRRLFISRRQGMARNCRNLPEVQALFESYGFAVIFPEELSVPEQATMFRNAEVVAGLAGSALCNVLFCENLRNVIVLAHEAYTARNEYLFASVLGSRLDYFWSAPDVSHPKDGWSQAAFTSAWDFDFAKNGGELESLLRSLD